MNIICSEMLAKYRPVIHENLCSSKNITEKNNSNHPNTVKLHAELISFFYNHKVYINWVKPCFNYMQATCNFLLTATHILRVYCTSPLKDVCFWNKDR